MTVAESAKASYEYILDSVMGKLADKGCKFTATNITFKRLNLPLMTSICKSDVYSIKPRHQKQEKRKTPSCRKPYVF